MVILDLVLDAFAGLLAAIVMTLVETFFWKKWGFQGVVEWQINWIIMSHINKKWKRLVEPKLSWTIISHLLHGLAAGIIFGILLPILLFVGRLPKVSSLWLGLVYGMGLWFLFAYLSRDIFEYLGKIRMTNRGIFGALLSDSIYGFILGLLIWIGSL
jgi:hypothetical protein